MTKKKSFLIICGVALLLVIGVFVYRGSDIHEKLSPDDSAEEWKGDQKLPSGNDKQEMIAVPGYDTITFNCASTEQKVNFYNPEENKCLFRLTLIINDKQYWQSGYCEPGHGYYDITLDQILEKGTYDASLLTECFREDGTQLNSAKVEFTIESEEL